MDTAPVRFVTQKDKMFEDLAPDDASEGNGSANGNGHATGNGHGTGNGNGNGHALTPPSDTGPTGPFTALSSSELAAVTVDEDEDEDADLEDLSEELEVAEDSVRARMPVAPPGSGVPTMAATPLQSLEAEAADLDWSVEEAATRAVGGAEAFEAEQAPAQGVTSHGMPAPRLEGAYVAPAAPPPAPPPPIVPIVKPGFCSASPKAAALSNRSAGSFSSDLAVAATTLVGTDFRSLVTGCASSVTIFMMICWAEAPVWGGFPVSIS